jgi:voltage-gated potassium channel
MNLGLNLILSFSIILVSFSLLYYFFKEHYSGLVTFFDAFYYSSAITATIGFGEIQPITQFGKLLVVLNIIVTVAIIIFMVS